MSSSLTCFSALYHFSHVSDISSLISSRSTPIVTLRLSSILFSHSDDNLSLCTFASRNYREGMFAPRLIVGSQDDATVSSKENSDDNKMTMLSSNIIGIPNHSSQNNSNKEPHKIFPPKRPLTATTQKVSKCAAPYSPSKIYAHDDVVSNQYKNYRCKAYPYTVWCNEERYEPGVSLFWGLAWDLVNGT